jgi:hypothetical protein
MQVANAHKKTLRISLSRPDGETLRLKVNTSKSGATAFASHRNAEDAEIGRSDVRYFPDMAAAAVGLQQWADDLSKDGWRRNGNGSATNVTFGFGELPKPDGDPRAE